MNPSTDRTSPAGQESAPGRLGPWRWALVGLLYVAVLVGQTYVTREVFTSQVPGANDFYPRWAGGCRLFWEGADPYSDGTTEIIQRGVYGRPARPGEDQVAFAYPLYVLAFIWPTCLLRDFATVQAAWMTVSIHFLLAGTILMKRIAHWRASRMLALSALAWTVFVYPNARAILLGQLAVLVFLLLALSLWALLAGFPWVAGFALAGTTIKPQLSFLIIPWLLLWGGLGERRQAVWGFGLGMVTLIGGAALLQPNWIGGFLDQLRRYPTYTELGSGIWIMTTYYLGTPRVVEAALTALALLFLLSRWARHRRGGPAEMLWVTSMTLVITHFISFRTATTHFSVFMLPLFLIFEEWRQQRPRLGGRWAGLTLLLVLVGSWALFLLTVEGERESAINYLPIPLILLTVLLARRDSLIAARSEAR